MTSARSWARLRNLQSPKSPVSKASAAVTSSWLQQEGKPFHSLARLGGQDSQEVSDRIWKTTTHDARRQLNSSAAALQDTQESKHDIVLESFEVHDSCIVFRTRVAGVPFHLTKWSLDGGMKKLQQALGDQHFNKVAFFWYGHELHRYITLDATTVARERTIDCGPFNCFVNEETAADITNFWRFKMHNQWCRVRDVDFEDMVPSFWMDHGVPQDASLGKPCNEVLEKNGLGDRGKVLALCGGGKDTLLVCTLLEQIKTEYGLYHESYSVYGSQMVQHKTMDKFLNATGDGSNAKYHNFYIMDDFYESPASQCLDSKESHMGALAAGSEICGCPGAGDLFSVLFTMIQHGYSHVAVGYEKSAEVEDSNQASKTTAWQDFASDIIRKHILSDFAIYSPIAAFHDTAIYHSLGELGKASALQYTSSCNISKPWCKKCAKCATVWLGFRCYCWSDEVDNAFGNENLLDSPELEGIWQQVTQVSDKERFSYFDVAEAQLMLHQLSQKGVTGRAIDLYNQNPMSESVVLELVNKLTEWDPEVYPKEVSPKLSSLAQTLLSRANTTLTNRLNLPIPTGYLYSHEEGGANWDAVAKHPDYYPLHDESMLISQWDSHIKEALKDVDVLIELCPGSGSKMRDTVWNTPHLQYVGVDVSPELLGMITDSYPEGRTSTYCADIFDKQEDFRWMDELRRKHMSDRVAVAYLGSSWSNHLNDFASCFFRKMNHRLQSDMILTSFDMWQCDSKYNKADLLRAAYDNDETAKFILDGYAEQAKQAGLNGDEINAVHTHYSKSVTDRIEDGKSRDKLKYSVDVDEETKRVYMYAENTARPNDKPVLVEWSRKFKDDDLSGFFKKAGVAERDSVISPRGFKLLIVEDNPVDRNQVAAKQLRQNGFAWINYDNFEDSEEKWDELKRRSSQMWHSHPLPWVRHDRDIVRRAGYARRKVENGEVGLARSTNHDEADLQTLGLHHDFLHECFVPRLTAFRVERHAETGGESLICDMQKVRHALKSDTRGLLETQPLRYHMNLQFNSDAAYSTDLFLGTTDEDVAATRVDQIWGHNTGYHTELIHDLSGDNGGKSLHVSFECLGTLPDGSLHENLTSFGLAGNNLPYWAEFANGGDLAPVIEELREAEAAKMETLALTTGDILVFSNIRCKHGRMGYNGDRRVHVIEH